MGNACWELYCLEHGIQPDGTMPSDRTVGSQVRLEHELGNITSEYKRTERYDRDLVFYCYHSGRFFQHLLL